MWVRLGLRAVRAGDYAEARRYFQWAREAGPDNVVALLWLAGLTENRDEAVALLSRVLELDPHNERARAGIRALCRSDEVPAAVGAAEVEPVPPPAEAVEVPPYRKVGQVDAAPAIARPERWSRWILAMLVAAVVLVVVGWLAFGHLRGLVAPLERSVPTLLAEPTAILPATAETPVPAVTPAHPTGSSAGSSATQAVVPTPAASASRSASPTRASTRVPTPAAPTSTVPGKAPTPTIVPAATAPAGA